jgi:uncharacterized membrane protein YraQ (UPF0718 family)
MIILIVLTLISLVISYIADKKKTTEAIKSGFRMFLNILPNLLVVLILISAFLYFIPEPMIVKILGAKSGIKGLFIAAIFGSIGQIPPFVLFPIAKILLSKGVSYMVVAVFITNLMMVGVLTFPIELKFFGMRAALMRNVLSFFGAILIGILMGIFM